MADTNAAIISSATTQFPERYYASYDETATQPTSITGWYDTWGMSSLSNVPPASSMIPIAETDWNNTTSFRLSVGRGVQSGKIIDYTPAPVPVPLTTQASSALSSARIFVYNNYGILNEATPDVWVSYIKSLMAISSGADTTSTSLPSLPAVSA
ncbi:hypothetical protein [Gluconacetobacter diazotrophicus]|uniref:hypothetical protein n=1 Tax=Gluconacetobacter diazotrophicus TaxID=33996 RepID=UPI000173B3F5|nr:hypothetical protein [Gluconacetobacter diazotrophicus]